MNTRKDFISTAKTLRDTKASNETINMFARKFQAENPRFDVVRFKNFIKGSK